MSIRKKLKELRKIASLHLDWLSYVLLQDDSNEEALRKYGKLPMDRSIDLVRYAHKLGQLRMMLKAKEYKDLKFSDLEKEIEKEPLTSPEQATVEQGRHAVDDGVRQLAGKMIKAGMNAIYTRVTAHSVSGDAKVDQALADDPKVKKVLVSMAANLLSEYQKEWERQLYTEVQVSKNRGAVQAIVQRKGPYQGSDGIDSRVSIVPRPNACEDCVHHYIDPKTKNPRIFILRALIEAGTNADPGVKHTRSRGIHNHWKSTLSPLHLGCGCRITYVPPGTGWKDGKLVMLDQETFKKAVDAHAKTQLSTPPPSPPSVAGVAAPSNDPGPGRPASPGAPGIEYDYEPVSEGKPEGPGWKQTESGQSYKRPKGMGGKGGKLTDEDKQLLANAEVDSAKKWHANDKPDSVVLDHITKGKITTVKDLSQGEDSESVAGVNETSRITIDGNGRAAMKPGVDRDEDTMKGMLFGAGVGSVPAGTEPKREMAAYNVSQLLGGVGGVPPTGLRHHEGKLKSVQSWKEKTAVTTESIEYVEGMAGHEMIISNAPPQAMNKVKDKLSATAVLDIVMNNNDRHFDNLTITEDGSDFYAIDHGFSFGTGMAGHRGDIHRSFHKTGEPLKIPPKMKERMDNTSYGDYKRSMAASGVEDWAIAQTFLRSRYASALQEKEGHLDYEKFRSTMNNGQGQTVPTMGMWNMKTKSSDIPEGMSSQEHTDREYINTLDNNPNSQFIDFHVEQGNLTKAGVTEFLRREKEGLLPDQLFNSWAQNHLEAASESPSHKDHAAAKEMLGMGVFMGPGFFADPKKYRETGQHHAQGNVTKPGVPPNQVGKNKPLHSEESTGTLDIGTQDIEPIEAEEGTVVEKGLTYVSEE